MKNRKDKILPTIIACMSVWLFIPVTGFSQDQDVLKNHIILYRETAMNSGGGVHVAEGGRLNLVNSTVTGNNSLNHGGAIYSEGKVNVVSSTISGNSGKGGGVFSFDEETNIVNSILFGNYQSSSMSDVHTSGNAFTQLYYSIFGNIAGKTSSTEGNIFVLSGDTEAGLQSVFETVAKNENNMWTAKLAGNDGKTQSLMLSSNSKARSGGVWVAFGEPTNTLWYSLDLFTWNKLSGTKNTNPTDNEKILADQRGVAISTSLPRNVSIGSVSVPAKMITKFSEIENNSPGIYPNPIASNSVVTLTSAPDWMVRCEIIDTSGKFIPAKLTSNQYDYSFVSPEKQGVYIIRIIYKSGELKTYKLIVM